MPGRPGDEKCWATCGLETISLNVSPSEPIVRNQPIGVLGSASTPNGAIAAAICSLHSRAVRGADGTGAAGASAFTVVPPVALGAAAQWTAFECTVAIWSCASVSWRDGMWTLYSAVSQITGMDAW
ncbi:Uncharacterised protein [Mycobacteroides abscessus subsp. abscessus]|nr:Uncharacterised protein [Mycobacteroides abscessus subsp. abscessus]